MKKQEKIQKFMNDAFNEMFIRVGFNCFDVDFTKNPNWYTLKSWTMDEENSYRDWFITEYRKRFRSRKAYAEDECRWFLFNYGWTIKDFNIK